jgi:pimeloyl-ACP methyl ester carboxylesterase
MKTVYIHGATASERSFAFIAKSLRTKDPIYLNYQKEGFAQENLAEMVSTLDAVDEPVVIVAHSLGGVYATYLQHTFDKVKGVVSLATPFGGSELATWGSIFNPHYQLFKDIRPTSDFIRNSRSVDIRCPWTQVVTTVGDVPWIQGTNDGIVTRSSMMCRDDVEYTEIDRNHYEIVLSKRVIEIIKNFVKKIDNDK